MGRDEEVNMFVFISLYLLTTYLYVYNNIDEQKETSNKISSYIDKGDDRVLFVSMGNISILVLSEITY